MILTVYTASCAGNRTNCVYPNRVDASSPEELAVAAAFDHVCAEYRNSYRSNDNFIEANCLMMDCDNDLSENPADWISAERVGELLPEVSYAVVPSRHNMLPKNGKQGRPRFHIYFEIPLCRSAEDYAALKKSVHASYPFLDDKALDAARFVFGSDAGEVEWHEGWMTVDEVLGEPAPAKEQERSPSYREGTRNSSMSRFAGRVLKRYGVSEKAKELFLKEAEKCEPPLPEDELETVWNSAVKFAGKVSSEEGYVSPEEYNADFRGASLRPDDYSDIGQAKVLAREYSSELIFTDATDYLRYTGEVWVESKQQAVGAAEEFLDLQYQDAKDEVEAALAALETHGISRAEAAEGGKKLESRLNEDSLSSYYRYLAALSYEKFVLKRRDMKYILSALQTMKPMVLHSVQELDRNEFLLNVPGATYDLRSGLDGGRAPSADDLITKQTVCAPGNEGAEEWANALDTFFCGDKELISYVQQIVGLSAIGKVYNEALIIAYGEGRNGKSTFWNAVSRVLGSYSGSISADTLTVGCKRNVKPEIAELKGKRLIIAAELEEGMRLNTSIVKQLCSTDDIEAEKKYKDPFRFTPSHTVVLYTNHLPRVGANDEGTWRRLIVIPFNARIEGGSDKKNYADLLVENAGPAIMKWIIEGAQKAVERGFHLDLPECVKEAVGKYREHNDWMGNFLEDCCDTGKELEEKSGELYRTYREYCLSNGEYARSTADFYSALETAGFERSVRKNGKFIKGLRLKFGGGDLLG